MTTTTEPRYRIVVTIREAFSNDPYDVPAILETREFASRGDTERFVRNAIRAIAKAEPGRLVHGYAEEYDREYDVTSPAAYATFFPDRPATWFAA